MERILKPSFRIKKSFDVSFDQNEAALLTIGLSVSRWSLVDRKAEVTRKVFPHPSSVDIAPDGNRAAIKSTSGNIAAVDPVTLEHVTDFGSTEDGEGSNLLFSPCSDYLIDGTWEGRLKVRNATDANLVYEVSYDHSMVTILSTCATRATFAWVVAPKAISNVEPPPPDYIVIQEWPFGRKKPRELSTRFDRISSLSMSPDGTRLALVTGIPPSRLVVMNQKTDEIEWSCPIEVGGCGGNVAWSPDMMQIAGVSDRGIDFFRCSDSHRTHRIPLDYACAVSYSGSGRFIALGSWEKGLVVSSKQLDEYGLTGRV